MAKKTTDITQTGPVGLRGIRGTDLYGKLQGLAASGNEDAAAFLNGLSNKVPTPYSYGDVTPYYTPVQDAEDSPWRELGNSTYDDPYIVGNDVSAIQDTRADRQPWYMQLINGIGKGVALAGTTFLDGTVGLLTGLAEWAATGDVSKLWDNEVSNGLREFNENMEKWLPNYRSTEEQNRSWYENLGTMNFWADSFLKNMGFTVGALYSGISANAALKGMHLMKNSASLGAKLTGSLFSAVNEGRIEANHTVSDLKELQVQQAQDAYQIAKQNILNNKDFSDTQRIAALESLDQNAYTTLMQIDENLKKAGLTDFVLNIPILALDNFWTFGRMYNQGFKNAKNVATENVKKGLLSKASTAANEAAAAAENTLVQQTKKQGGKYIWDTITNKKAIGKGLLTGLREGNEEMMQAMASEFAGNWNFYKDSPDTYYRAMTDPKALAETTDAWAALAESFVNTYGNFDKYEEFAVGALTGLLGTPTFGKSQNASANTYLGRGKTVGISGGLFGEMATAREENQIGQAHVDNMNKLADKIRHNKGLLAASKKYTDAMHAWAEENDAFEYKNQEDNEDWRGITSFLSTGRKADLLALIDQDFENASDEELAAIAAFTTPDGSTVGSGGWRDASGHLITANSAQQDKDNMRKELAKKRDKMKKNIENYERSLAVVRNLVNGSDNVSEDEVNELAWLHWKMSRFSDRYNEVISDPDNKEAYQALDYGLQSYEDALREQTGEGLYDTSDLTGAEKARYDAENAVIRERVKTAEDSLLKVQQLRKFLQTVVTSKGHRQLISARDLKANLEVLDNLMQDHALYEAFIEQTGISEAEVANSLRQLQDLGRLSEAFVQFNKRFSDFTQDPNKLRANRQQIDKENAEMQETIDGSTRRQKARSVPIDELKTLDDNELDEILDSLDSNNPNDVEKLDAVKAEQKKRKTGNAIRNRLRDMEQAALDNEDVEATNAIQAALTKLEQAQAEADNADELLDLDNEIYQGLSQLEAQSPEDEALEDAAFAQLSQAIDAGIKAVEEAENMQAEDKDVEKDEKTGEVVTPAEKASTPAKDTGHDPVADTPAVNQPKKPERKKSNAEKAAERQAKKKNKRVKYEAKQQRKAEEEKSAQQKEKNSQLIFAATTELLQQLAGEIGLNEEIFATALDLVSRAFTELEDTTTPEEVAAAAKRLANQDEWKDFNDAVALPLSDELLLYIVSYLNNLKNTEEVSDEDDSSEARERRVGITTQTPDIDINSDNYERLDWTPINLGSWMSLVREYPIHGRSTSPYHQSTIFKNQLRNKLIQKGLKGEELEKAFNAEVQRLTAVYDYLKEHNAFSNAAKVQAPKGRQSGTKIYFVVDPTLNSKAGETVILMSTEPNGSNIVGAVRGNNEIVSEQAHLQSFINRTVEAFEKASPDTIWASNETTHVAQVLPGRVMFSDRSYSLNEIYSKGTDVNSGTEEFLLGIYMPDGSVVMSSRTKKSSRTKTEKRAKTPYKKAVKGQPFLMIPTGEGVGKYIPVPIHMNLFGPQMATSMFAQFVADHLDEALVQRMSTKKGQLALKLALEDLFAHQFHVNIQGGKFKIAATMQDGTQRNIVETNLRDVTTSSIIEALKNAGLGIQINRKYINDKITINGTEVNYNEVIGELAATNIAPGFGHTVNDFFTLNPINNKGEEENAEKLENRQDPINDDAKTDETSKTPVTVSGTVYYLRSDDRITDASGKVITVDSDILVKIKAAAEITNNSLVSVDSANPTVYHTSYGFYDTKKSKFIGEKDLKEEQSEAVAVSPEEIRKEFEQVTDADRHRATVDYLEADGSNSDIGGLARSINTSARHTYTSTDKAEDHITMESSMSGQGSKIVFGKQNSALDSRVYAGDLRQNPGIKEVTIGNKTAIIWSTPGSIAARGGTAGLFFDRKLTPQEARTVMDTITSDTSNKVNAMIGNVWKALTQQPSSTPSIELPQVLGITQQSVNAINAIKEWLKSLKVPGLVAGDTVDNWIEKLDNFGQTTVLQGGVFELLRKEFIKEVGGMDNFDDIINGRAAYTPSSGQTEGTAKKPTVQRLSTKEDSVSQEDIEAAMQDTSEGKKVMSFSFSGKKAETATTESKAGSSIPSCFNTTALKNMFNTLTKEQQATVAALPVAQQRQVMNKLKLAFKGGKFTKDVDSLITPSKYRVSDSAYEKADIKKEVEWLDKVLPQLSREQKVAIVDGLIKVANSSTPQYAWGKFQNGIITLSRDAAKGTTYHEAFHFVSQTLLTDSELDTLYKEGAKKYKLNDIDEIEERLAEDYRKYVQLEQTPILGSAVKIYRKLKHLVQGFFGNESFTNNLFYRISNGKLANKKAVNSSNRARASVANTEEMNTIKQQAIANGTFMKAPNGNPTNLNERQWLQVRTKAFKEWFGDWENDAANASKVVDENGEPLVVYHGTESNFTTFEVRNTLDEGFYGKGIYFTNAEEYANVYGSNNIPVFLNVRNPKTMSADDDSMFGKEITDNDAVIADFSDTGTNWKEYVVVNPNQIKSATDNVGTFSNENDDIRYRLVDIPTAPVRPEYKGKLIFAQSGTGKTTIADNINLIDSDYLLADVLGTSVESAGVAFNSLDQNARMILAEQYHQKIIQALANGKTVVTASPSMLNEVDVVIYNQSSELSNRRTNTADRVGRNRFLNTAYHEEVLDRIAKLKNENQQKVALDNATFLADIILSNPSYRAPQTHYQAATIDEAINNFLTSFGFNVNQVESYNNDMPLFDALNRTINARSKDDITEGVGYAVAFMMQNTPEFRELVAVMHAPAKSVKRALTKHDGAKFTITEKNFASNKSKYIVEVGREVADELRAFYGQEQSRKNQSLLSRLWKMISQFFELLSPKNREYVSQIQAYTKYMADAIIRNDSSYIKRADIKPGDTARAVKVNLEEALNENPYEAGILKKLAKHGFSLTGSAALSVQGDVYRKPENPLHDMDFNSPSTTTKEDIEKMLQEEFNNFSYVRTIHNDNYITQTYLVLDRPFEVRRELPNIAVESIFDKRTGEKIGSYVKSELVLNEGIKGKFLDFFTGEKNNLFGTIDVNIAGQKFKVTDARGPMTAKLEYNRPKDIFDYIRFVPSSTETKADIMHQVQKYLDDLTQDYLNQTITEAALISKTAMLVEKYADEGFRLNIQRSRKDGVPSMSVKNIQYSQELKESRSLHSRRSAKVAFANLTSTQKQLLTDLGVSQEAYETMTDYEKEEFWRCKS